MKTNTILQICIGIAIVIFSIGFLIRSVNPAEALPTPNKFLTEGTNKIGKYMIQMYTNSRDTGRRYGIVWDTETGKSMGYYEERTGWVSEKIFPENPLGN